MKVVVENCAGCVFFRKTLISLFASGGDPNAGDCACPGETPTGEISKAKTLPVKDNRILPAWCPLRLGDVVVTIGNRGTT